MVANKINFKYIVFTFLCVLPFLISAKSEVSDRDVINFLYKNVAKSTTKLGNEIEICEKKRVSSDHVLLNVDKLKTLKSKNKDVIIALTYMNFRNIFKCEKRARVNLAYDLGLLASVKRKNESKTKDINEIEDNLIYPSVKQIRLSIKYSKLPAKLRKYVEKIVGNQPFDLIKTLKSNHLLDL